MGFLPFVNQGGQRIVRWHRLALRWSAVILACILGNGAVTYALMGDFWHDDVLTICFGVFLAACVTVRGFTLPVEHLSRGLHQESATPDESRTQRATLGCGTLILIALIVLFLRKPGIGGSPGHGI
jgi:hypothetical protein